MSKPLTREDLAEALDCFWNAAEGARRNQQSDVSCIIEGIQAVANGLRELDRRDEEKVRINPPA